MTKREQRAIRKIWSKKTRKYRVRVKLQTPPELETPPEPPLPQNNIALATKRRSESQRKLHNKLIKKQKNTKLKSYVKRYVTTKINYSGFKNRQ
ncbi:hypothetical protein WA026_019673 [Henosepilachna vigintioctopunctata]|uniref:Uncharacterized protein n=1 Tax=Henosepilachna vigintioctopunctata TaxID=420089 RepID=A0AAW1UMY2_9CUCU